MFWRWVFIQFSGHDDGEALRRRSKKKQKNKKKQKKNDDGEADVPLNQ